MGLLPLPFRDTILSPLVTVVRFLTVLRYNWWKYIILGVMDVEANYVLILAYRYTNLTSIQVVMCMFTCV